MCASVLATPNADVYQEVEAEFKLNYIRWVICMYAREAAMMEGTEQEHIVKDRTQLAVESGLGLRESWGEHVRSDQPPNQLFRKVVPKRCSHYNVCPAFVRCAQGHSFKFIDPNRLHVPVLGNYAAEIPVLVHGTHYQNIGAILRNGLKPGG